MLAVVTGSGRGIGKEIAKKLSENGYAVAVIFNSNERAADQTVEQIKQAGAYAKAFKCNVSDFNQVLKVFEEIVSCMGKIDLLVNNAGVCGIGLLQDQTKEEIDKLIDVDLKGTIYCSKAVIPYMVKASKGNIINIASMWGEVGASCETIYSAAKAGVIGFSKALAKELAPSYIRVNVVSPGLIDTDMNKNLSEEELDELISSTPLGRIGTAEDVANAVTFLASEKASFITGQVLSVNGGLII